MDACKPFNRDESGVAMKSRVGQCHSLTDNTINISDNQLFLDMSRSCGECIDSHPLPTWSTLCYSPAHHSRSQGSRSQTVIVPHGRYIKLSECGSVLLNSHSYDGPQHQNILFETANASVAGYHASKLHQPSNLVAWP